MYRLEDTIAAVSSAAVAPGTVGESILRVSGPRAFEAVGSLSTGGPAPGPVRGITHKRLCVEPGLEVNVTLYCFTCPVSYTGDDLIEIHVFAAPCVVERLLGRLLEQSRLAGPGEFTLRAYLNGKMDLTAAEAVGHIVTGSNRMQIAAAQRLLSGGLAEQADALGNEVLDLLSLIEGGMDFAGEDVRFIERDEAVARMKGLSGWLERFLADSLHCEELMDLPSVGLAGLPNAGKSSLVNALLGCERSITSDEPGTTRDVVGGVLRLAGAACTVFDCAGLTADECADVPARSARAAALAALANADVVVFCVEAAKSDVGPDAAVYGGLMCRDVVLAATKVDMLGVEERPGCMGRLQERFGKAFVATSSRTGEGLDELRAAIGRRVCGDCAETTQQDGRLALGVRHRGAIEAAAANVRLAAVEAAAGRDETAAMYLRGAYNELKQFDAQGLDEAILERIFARFCVGK